MRDQAHPLRVERVPLADLIPYEGNARQGDIGAICESLQAHGQYRPLVVQASTMTVLAGNGTLAAATQLGWEEIAVTRIDVDDDQARRIVLVDNRTNDLAGYDDHALAALLQPLAETAEGLAGTGFDGDALDDLLRELDQPLDLSDLGGDMPDHDEEQALAGTVEIRVVEYHFAMSRTDYEAWIEQLKMAAGDSREAVVAELRERLGIETA